MTRWGVGPKLAALPSVYGLLAVVISWRRPDLCVIRVVPYTILASLGTVLFLMGAWGYARALRFLNQALAAGSLATTGPYAFCRHPVYAAWVLGIFPGVTLLARIWPLVIMPLLAYGSFRFLIVEEEVHLSRIFGERHRRYAAQVPLLVPQWRRKAARCSERPAAIDRPEPQRNRAEGPEHRDDEDGRLLD